MKCFTLPLKLLSFLPFGVLILALPNRWKWSHTACTDQHATQYQTIRRALKRGVKYCIAGAPDKVSCQNTSYSSGISLHYLFNCKLCDIIRSLHLAAASMATSQGAHTRVVDRFVWIKLVQTQVCVISGRTSDRCSFRHIWQSSPPLFPLPPTPPHTSIYTTYFCMKRSVKFW